MDVVLRKAVMYMLKDVGELIDDLVLIELHWGERVPPLMVEPDELSFQGASWPVVFSSSELILRRTLCRSFDGRAILIIPRGGGFEIPRDIRARASRHPQPSLGLRHCLYALTGCGWPAEVDHNGWRSSIERHFDSLLDSVDATRLPSMDVTRHDLELKLVKAAFGFTVGGHTGPQLLAGLLSQQRRSGERATELERSLLQGQLQMHGVGQADILLWAAKEPGRAELLVRTGMMMGAEQSAGLVPNWGELNRLRTHLVSGRKMLDTDAIARVIALAKDALPFLHHATRKALVVDAERFGAANWESCRKPVHGRHGGVGSG